MPSRLAQRRSYERQVKALSQRAAQLLGDRIDEESVARIVVDRRNRLKAQFRDGLDSETLAWIEERNRVRYGNPLGPTAEALFDRYGSWKEVIAAAARPAQLS